MPLLVVPDTNVFVHFRPFDDVPWNEVFGGENIVFVVLAPVVRELDKLKMEPRLRDRVRAVLPRIEALFGDSDEAKLRTGIPARFEHCRNALTVMSELFLEPSVGDDRILAGAIALGRGPDPVVLLTDDTGVRLRARALGLSVRGMPEELRLLSSDPLAAENAKLRRELDEVRNTMPSLEVRFLEGGTVLRTARALPAKRSLRFSDIFPRPLSAESLPAVYEYEREKPTQSEMDEYNRKLEAFRPTHEKYLRDREEFELFPFVSLGLETLLRNIGGRPAQGVRVTFELPAEARLVKKKDVPKEPARPVPPQLPGRRRVRRDDEALASFPGLLKPAFASESLLSVPRFPVHEPPPNVAGPLAVSDREVAYEVQLVSNFDEVELPRMLLRFPNPESVGSFQMPYSLRAHNLPRLLKGTLHVVVEQRATESPSAH